MKRNEVKLQLVEKFTSLQLARKNSDRATVTIFIYRFSDIHTGFCKSDLEK